MKPANRILHIDGDSFFASCEIALDLGLQPKQAHWNVRWPRFIGLQELFGKVAEELDEFYVGRYRGNHVLGFLRRISLKPDSCVRERRMRMTVKSILCRLTLFLGLSFVGAQAATCYVATTGRDSNPGTSAQPFRTVTYAYSKASAGTTVIVAPGTYTDYTSGWGWRLNKSGTASSPIVLKSQVRGGAILDSGFASSAHHGIYLDGSYNIVDGFVITRAPITGVFVTGGNSSQIINCEIYNNGTVGTSDPVGQGIYSDQNTSDNKYVGNYIHDNGFKGSNLDHGLYLCGQRETIANNVVIRHPSRGLQIAGYLTINGMKVYNNVFAYNGLDGITVWQAMGSVDIRNNICFKNGRNGVEFYAATGGGVTIDHNLIYGSASASYNLTDGGSTASYTLGKTISSDPKFVNNSSSSFNAHLNSGSPAIGAGLNFYSTITSDKAGALRPSSGSWDLGAYVYGATNSQSNLQVRTIGHGTISPNYSNALLEIGKSYRITASPGTGFVFTNWVVSTNWIGASVTNSATVNFIMSSNLTLQANFVDASKPTLSITNLVAGQRISSAVFIFRGSATDNWQVGAVVCKINNDTWTNAAGTNNWSLQVTAVPGTNTFYAYAVDSAGNRSVTNSRSFQFVVTNLLGVRVYGLGAISPNYSNQWLEVGRNYTITATPGTGCVLTNWLVQVNGSTVLSTNKAVPFLMESNEVLTVTFADVQPPTVSITTPTPGLQLVTNSPVFTVRGKAADNVAVASVFCSVSNPAGMGAWTLATGATNWNAAVTLAPGTNTISAYAVDTSSNLSFAASPKMFYAVSAPITLNIVGKGTVSGAINGQLLVIGKNVTLHATPGTGFGFYFWSGGVPMSTNATLNVTMTSNLIIIANFRNMTPPTVTLTSPAGNESVTTNEIMLAGKATGNDVAVSNVRVQLNNTGWNPVATFDGTNWTANIPLVVGTNLIQVYAEDRGGLDSKVVNINIVRGVAPTVFPIYQDAAFHNPQAEIAFDGNNYLVVFQTESSGSVIPTAQLVSRSGSLAAPLLQIPVSGGADPPEVSFDGTNYLMAWNDFDNQIEGPGIHGEFVNTSGGAIGRRSQITQSTTVDYFRTMVFGGGVYFLMWSDSREANTTGYDAIYGAMVAPDGTLAVSDFEISPAAGQNLAGQGAAGFDGTNFLATWDGAARHFSVNGRLISPTGNFITAPFNIYTNNTLPPGLSLNSVAFDGTKYLVLFSVGAGSGLASTWHIQGRFVTTAGEVLTNRISITTDAGPQIVPCATFDGTHYLITWNQGFNRFSAATTGSIKARWFDINGNPTAPEFTLFTPPAGQTALWAPLLFDGSQYFSVGGLGRVLTPAPDLTFTNGILTGAILSP